MAIRRCVTERAAAMIRLAIPAAGKGEARVCVAQKLAFIAPSNAIAPLRAAPRPRPLQRAHTPGAARWGSDWGESRLSSKQAPLPRPSERLCEASCDAANAAGNTQIAVTFGYRTTVIH
jgi:hypothetical protein